MRIKSLITVVILLDFVVLGAYKQHSFALCVIFVFNRDEFIESS